MIEKHNSSFKLQSEDKKYSVYVDINYPNNSYQILNSWHDEPFKFGGRKSNRHLAILKLMTEAVEFADNELKQARPITEGDQSKAEGDTK